MTKEPMLSHTEYFTEPNIAGARLLGLRKSALAETVIFLGLLVVINIFLGDGTRYINVSPHPFWIIVLLVSANYGIREGLMSAFFSSVFLLAFNIPEQTIDQTIHEHILQVSYHPILWFIAALILGELREKHIKERNELRQSLAEAEKHELAITDAYLQLKNIKEKLETQIASDLHSNVQAYNAIKSLESLNPSKTLLGLEEVVTAVMHPKKFSIFALGKDGLEAVICSGWNEEESYQRRLPASSPLYQDIVGRQHMVSCNHEKDLDILGHEGILAAPLIDHKTGQVFGMLKIEDIGFMELTHASIETFRIICEVAGMAHSNAVTYQDSKAHGIKIPQYELYTSMMFQEQILLFKELAKHNTLASSVIELQLDHHRLLTDDERRLLISTIKEAVLELSPHTTIQIYEGSKQNRSINILLPGLIESKAQAIASGLKDLCLKKQQALFHDLQFTTSTQALS